MRVIDINVDYEFGCLKKVMIKTDGDKERQNKIAIDRQSHLSSSIRVILNKVQYNNKV